MKHLSTPQQVTLGYGSSLKGPAEGAVKLETLLPDGTTQKKYFVVPKLSYSLLSVSKVSKAPSSTNLGFKS